MTPTLSLFSVHWVLLNDATLFSQMRMHRIFLPAAACAVLSVPAIFEFEIGCPRTFTSSSSTMVSYCGYWHTSPPAIVSPVLSHQWRRTNCGCIAFEPLHVCFIHVYSWFPKQNSFFCQQRHNSYVRTSLTLFVSPTLVFPLTLFPLTLCISVWNRRDTGKNKES